MLLFLLLFLLIFILLLDFLEDGMVEEILGVFIDEGVEGLFCGDDFCLIFGIVFGSEFFC